MANINRSDLGGRAGDMGQLARFQRSARHLHGNGHRLCHRLRLAGGRTRGLLARKTKKWATVIATGLSLWAACTVTGARIFFKLIKGAWQDE